MPPRRRGLQYYYKFDMIIRSIIIRVARQGPAESAGPTTTGTSLAEDQNGMLVQDQKIKWPAR